MGIHDACPIHEEPYCICGCIENADCKCMKEGTVAPECRGPNTCYENWQNRIYADDEEEFFCTVCGERDADWDNFSGELRCYTHTDHTYIPDPDPEYYGGPDYDLARDIERGK